jgi:hypothetical protein
MNNCYLFSAGGGDTVQLLSGQRRKILFLLYMSDHLFSLPVNKNVALDKIPYNLDLE